MLVKNIVVKGCNSCPFFERDQTLWCGHPSHKSEAEAHIIHRDHLHELPAKCPLLHTPVQQVIKLNPEGVQVYQERQ